MTNIGKKIALFFDESPMPDFTQWKLPCIVVLIGAESSFKIPGISPFLNNIEATQLRYVLSAIYPESREALARLKTDASLPYSYHIFTFLLTAIRGTAQSIESWVAEEIGKLNIALLLLHLYMPFLSISPLGRRAVKNLEDDKIYSVMKRGSLLYHSGDKVQVWHNIVAYAVLKYFNWLTEPGTGQGLVLSHPQHAKLLAIYEDVVTELLLLDGSTVCSHIQEMFVERGKHSFSRLTTLIFEHLRIRKKDEQQRVLISWLSNNSLRIDENSRLQDTLYI